MDWTALQPHTLDLPQGRITYREAGAGDPIVFIHGLLVHGAHWRKVITPLSGDFRCIVPDLPLGAHAEPMNADTDLTPPGLARIIAEFIAALRLERVTVIGNDTGGALTQVLLANHPEQIERVALVSCDAYESFFPVSFRALEALGRVPGLTWLTYQALRLRPVRRAVAWTVSREPPDDAVARSYAAPLAKPGIRRDLEKVLRGVHNKHTLAAAVKFAEFHRTVLIAWGERDRLFSRGLAQRLVRDFPDARLEIVAGAGTFVPEDRPDALAALIREFCGATVAA